MNPDAKNISSNQPVTCNEVGPKADSAPVPVVFFVLLALFVFGAGLYIDKNGGELSQQVYKPYADYADVVINNPKVVEDPSAAQGRKIYATACVPCHQANGMGSPGQFPPLAGSEWVNTSKPDRMIRIVLNGFTGPVSVKGSDFNNTMPPWRDVYKDEEIAAVITFVRGNKDWGNKAGVVKPEDVKKIRDATKDRSTPWTAPELQSVPEK